MSFPCDRCGACCRHLELSPLYKDLDRGDGVCKYLSGNLCSIYETRPLLCRVDDCYTAFFKGQYSLYDYYELNQKACNKIKQLDERKESLCHYR